MEGFVEQYKISYMVEGQGDPFVIFHGWGCNKEMFRFLVDEFSDKYKVYSFDLPGFGKSGEPDKVINTLDHANIMKGVMRELGIVKPIGLGHSHGGRILIQMAESFEFKKLILTGAAGIVNKRPASYYVKVYTYKTLKRIYALPPVKALFPNMLDRYRKNAGSEDYKNASEIMKGVLSTVVNEDVTNKLDKIEAPTLLIWGENDSATPLANGKLMEEKIKDAGLVVFEGSTHYAFLEQRNRFITVLKAFI